MGGGVRVTAVSKVKSHLGASKRGEVWAGFMTWPVPSSLSHDASHTTGWKDGLWRGGGPFPKRSGEEEEEDDEEEEEGEQVLWRQMKKEQPLTHNSEGRSFVRRHTGVCTYQSFPHHICLHHQLSYTQRDEQSHQRRQQEWRQGSNASRQLYPTVVAAALYPAL